MKLHVMSDLHLEFRRQPTMDNIEKRSKQDAVEAVVLAGDINLMSGHGSPSPLIETLKWFAGLYPRVLYTPGNHEFFDYGLMDGLKLLKTVPSNVHVLQPGVKVDIGGLKFTGGTLWYPDCKERWLKKGWVDYELIHDGDPEIHAQHDLFIQKVLADPGDVVVSHHFPTTESISARFAGAPSNVFFCADIDDKIEAMKACGIAPPKLWIHGHTHTPFDYKSRLGFRVYCNPLGYPREGANDKFWDRILLDTDDLKWVLKTFNGGSNDD